MSNSSLIDVTILSPNCDKGRKHAIDTITIHCMAGDLSVESCGNWFAKPTTQASSNYGIDSKGRVGLYVDENDRSWCSSNAQNDHRAVTIEVASGREEPFYVNDVAYNKLILLVADICKRNNIKKLLWKADKSLIGQVDKQNMTVHRWFARKSCPGNYLYGKHYEIAEKVNKLLSNGVAPSNTAPTSSMLKVYVGAYKTRSYAISVMNDLKAKGFDCFVVQHGMLYKVQCGAFSDRNNAEILMDKLLKKGFTSVLADEKSIIYETKLPKPPKEFKIGDAVVMSKDATVYGQTTKFQNWVYDSTLYIRNISGDRVVVSVNKTGTITGAVDKKYLSFK